MVTILETHSKEITLYSFENNNISRWTTQGGSRVRQQKAGKKNCKRKQTPKNHVTEDQPVGPVHD